MPLDFLTVRTVPTLLPGPLATRQNWPEARGFEHVPDSPIPERRGDGGVPVDPVSQRAGPARRSRWTGRGRSKGRLRRPGRRRSSTLGLALNAGLQKELKVTPPQKTKLEALSEQANKKQQELRDQMSTVFRNLRGNRNNGNAQAANGGGRNGGGRNGGNAANANGWRTSQSWRRWSGRWRSRRWWSRWRWSWWRRWSWSHGLGRLGWHGRHGRHGRSRDGLRRLGRIRHDGRLGRIRPTGWQPRAGQCSRRAERPRRSRQPPPDGPRHHAGTRHHARVQNCSSRTSSKLWRGYSIAVNLAV